MTTRYYDGERIYFRPLEPEDAPRLAGWFNDPDNWRTLGRFQPISQLREREFVDALYKSNDQIVLGIVIRKDNRLIGCTGLSGICAVNRSAEFGITIGDRRRQGLGLGREATHLMLRYGFDERNLNRIELSVFADNERAIRAYRAAGFVFEGRHRQAYYRNGRYHDCLRFAILREEWYADRLDEQGAESAMASMTV